MKLNYTDEQFEKELGQLVNVMGIENLFPKESRAEEYRPYFKDEESLEMWLDYPDDKDDLKTVALNKLFLENLLEKLESERAIEFYERDGTEYKVRTSRYDVYMKLLHFGDVAQYTVNRKTNRKANYSKSMFRYAIQNNLEKYL